MVGATDNCGSVSVASVPASGSTFPVGTTIVTNTATDTHGNSSVCTFTVTVTDNEKPTISARRTWSCRADAGQCSKSNVTFVVGATDNCGSVSVVSVPPSGSTFPVGTTTVTNTATDTHGNSSVCTFTVTVTDNEKPVIVCPTNMVLSADAGQCSKSNVTFVVGATDNCGSVSVVSVPPSGSTFPVGTTIVTNTATDTHGNSSVCTFTVTVTDSQKPRSSARPTWFCRRCRPMQQEQCDLCGRRDRQLRLGQRGERAGQRQHLPGRHHHRDQHGNRQLTATAASAPSP